MLAIARPAIMVDKRSPASKVRAAAAALWRGAGAVMHRAALLISRAVLHWI